MLATSLARAGKPVAARTSQTAAIEPAPNRTPRMPFDTAARTLSILSSTKRHVPDGFEPERKAS